MKKRKVIEKMIFGDLLTIKRVANKPTGTEGTNWTQQWECQCSCGKIIITTSSNLLNKKSPKISCGCKNYTGTHGNQKDRDPQITSFISLIKRYRNSAKKKSKSIKWELTQEQAILLFKGNCYYCGTKPSNTYNVYKTKSGRYITANKIWADSALILFNGIDRIDSSLNYTVNNSVSCCTICNFAKNEMSLDNFYMWIDKIATYQGFIKNENSINKRSAR